MAAILGQVVVFRFDRCLFLLPCEFFPALGVLVFNLALHLALGSAFLGRCAWLLGFELLGR